MWPLLWIWIVASLAMSSIASSEGSIRWLMSEVRDSLMSLGADADAVCERYSGRSLGRRLGRRGGPAGLSSSTLPVGQPGPEGFFSQPRIGRTMFSAAIGVPL